MRDFSAEPAPEKVREFVALLSGARRAVVFTGAGMSTESGLPDFRSDGGLWKQSRRFEELASVAALTQDFAEFAEFYRFRMRALGACRPNVGHAILAAWQKRGLVLTLITQNVDGLHEEAGSTDVLCLHGSLRRVRCQRCGLGAPAETFLTPAGLECPSCRGPMRPNVVLFGETLDSATLDAAFTASKAADLFIVLGSSLLVSPANVLPRVAQERAAPLVIVNREVTGLDARARLYFCESIGVTLAAVDRELER